MLLIVYVRECRCRFDHMYVCCIDSGIFWTGIFEMPEVYITVDHVVDRSLERAVTLWRYVVLEYLLLVRFAKPNLCVWGGHI